MTDKEIDYKILQRENENLVREIEEIQSYLTDKVAESEIKAQAVKEFAERLKKRLNLLYEWQYAKVDLKTIDELLKEWL